MDKKQGFVLLEDLGNVSLETQISAHHTKARPYYRQALDQMVRLQEYRVNWVKFSSTDFFKEMLWTKTYLVDSMCSFPWKGDFLNKCFSEWDELCRTLGSFPFRPAHRDYHSQNLFIKEEKLYWIDFQDAALFPRCYDLASLLYDPYAGLSFDQRKSMVAYLLSQRPCAKQACEGKELILTALQRLFKACGSFASFYVLRNQKTHLSYIPLSLRMVHQLLKKGSSLSLFFKIDRTIASKKMAPRAPENNAGEDGGQGDRPWK